MKAAAAEILTHSVEEIEDHVEWYKEYLLLREQKREAIRNWKKLKQVRICLKTLLSVRANPNNNFLFVEKPANEKFSKLFG